MKRSSRWWLVFGICNLIVGAALVWMTAVVSRLEQAERVARGESAYHEALRSAMWRMDSWLAVFLARENARPHAQYRPYLLSGQATDATAISPLLTLESEYLPLHFEIDSDYLVSSPQLPFGPALPDPPLVPEHETARRQAALAGIRPHLDLGAIRTKIARAETMNTTKLAGAGRSESSPPFPEEAVKSRNEYEARVSCALPRPPGGDVGRLVPLWLDHPVAGEQPALVFVRRVHTEGREVYQGFVVDWSRLRQRLLIEIGDLFPVAKLLPASVASAAADPLGRYLANIPAALIAPAPDVPGAAWITPGRAALGLAWLAAILAAAVVGATLKKSIALGERRRRFVSAVTHELRTPLTTFRMYSEMLADGIVSDEGQRLQYLRTLKDESQRLSAMVENVLAHARIEEHRAPRHLENLSLASLLSRVAPPLTRQAEQSGMDLCVENDTPGSAPLEVDPEAIGQILGNLVDNAAKYARDGAEPRVHLEAAVRDGTLSLTVRDHGPGIASEQCRAIFSPFDRGGRDPSDPVPGIGLGLALARGMARDLGGDLTLERSVDGGACFRLELPTARSTG